MLNNHLLYSDFTSCFQIHDVDRIWSISERQVTNAMKLFIPVNKHNSFEYSPEIRHCIKRLRTLCHKYKLYPSSNTSTVIKELECTVQNHIKSAKLDFEFSLINNSALTNSNKIYKYIKSIIN